jgi:hypothetical protein
MGSHDYEVVLRLTIEGDCGYRGIAMHQALFHGDDTLPAQPLPYLSQIPDGPFIYVLGKAFMGTNQILQITAIPDTRCGSEKGYTKRQHLGQRFHVGQHLLGQRRTIQRYDGHFQLQLWIKGFLFLRAGY